MSKQDEARVTVKVLQQPDNTTLLVSSHINIPGLVEDIEFLTQLADDVSNLIAAAVEVWALEMEKKVKAAKKEIIIQ